MLAHKTAVVREALVLHGLLPEPVPSEGHLQSGRSSDGAPRSESADGAESGEGRPSADRSSEGAVRSTGLPAEADPLGALAAVGGLEIAGIAGLLLGGAALRTPVVVDGVVAGAAALVAAALAPTASHAWLAGHRSVEPAHTLALTHLGLEPLLDLGLRVGEGTGALLAAPLVAAAARALGEVATFDAAGVASKDV
jgi:nicotinate-nucleotide--dimethylbenzimidazole phosphoribosyltransferase